MAPGVKLTVAWPLPATAVTAVGISGTHIGVTLLEAADIAPIPTAFVALTAKVYAAPLVRPVTVIGLAVPVAVMPPGFDVTVYPVIGLPPFETGATKVTTA